MDPPNVAGTDCRICLMRIRMFARKILLACQRPLPMRLPMERERTSNGHYGRCANPSCGRVLGKSGYCVHCIVHEDLAGKPNDVGSREYETLFSHISVRPPIVAYR